MQYTFLRLYFWQVTYIAKILFKSQESRKCCFHKEAYRSCHKIIKKWVLTRAIVLAVHWVKIWIRHWILKIWTFSQTRRYGCHAKKLVLICSLFMTGLKKFSNCFFCTIFVARGKDKARGMDWNITWRKRLRWPWKKVHLLWWSFAVAYLYVLLLPEVTYYTISNNRAANTRTSRNRDNLYVTCS